MISVGNKFSLSFPKTVWLYDLHLSFINFDLRHKENRIWKQNIESALKALLLVAES